MSRRLSLTEIRDRIAGELADSTYVGTAKDRDYAALFPKTYPAAWVGAQRMRRVDGGSGYTGLIRQTLRTQVAVRVVVQKFADGETDGDARLDALCDRVEAALVGWRPAGADLPLAWEASEDGPPDESLLTADLIFFTTRTYTKRTA